MYMCQKCDRFFTTNKRLENHIVKKIPCDFVCKCNKQLANYSTYRYHVKICPIMILDSPKLPKNNPNLLGETQNMEILDSHRSTFAPHRSTFAPHFQKTNTLPKEHYHDIFDILESPQPILCAYCYKQFSNIRNVKRHEKHTCKLNPDISKVQCSNCPKKFSRIDAYNRHLQKCAENSINKTVTNVTNNNSNNNNKITNNDNKINKMINNINVNFQLNPFRQETIDHLTDKDYIHALQMPKIESVFYLTKLIWNNENVKENNNIRITNNRASECEVFNKDHKFEKDYKKDCVDFMMNYAIGKLIQFCHYNKKKPEIMNNPMVYPNLLDMIENSLSEQQERQVMKRLEIEIYNSTKSLRYGANMYLEELKKNILCPTTSDLTTTPKITPITRVITNNNETIRYV